MLPNITWDGQLMLSAADLRQWAVRYGQQAQEAESDEDIVRLLKMQAGLLELAETQDWLDGKRDRQSQKSDT